MTSKMKTIDLFSGVGGLSLGFQKAGFKILSAFDNWDKAIEVYKKNFKHPISQLDLSQTDDAISVISPLKPEIIIGGPPCQDFSHAGKRTEGTRADLTNSFANIISTVKPEWFVMENVDRAKNSSAYAQAKDIFLKSGYGLTEKVLDASLCGVPQKRKRFFCIGKLNEKNGFLDQILEESLSKKPLTVRKYFGASLGVEHYYRHPRNYNRRAVFSIDEPAPTIRGVNRPIPPNYVKHLNDPVGLDGLRPLTTEERARVQTFPEKFVWLGSKTDMEQMIGNAVPVELSKYVANAIMKYELSLKEKAGNKKNG